MPPRGGTDVWVNRETSTPAGKRTSLLRLSRTQPDYCSSLCSLLLNAVNKFTTGVQRPRGLHHGKTRLTIRISPKPWATHITFNICPTVSSWYRQDLSRLQTSLARMNVKRHLIHLLTYLQKEAKRYLSVGLSFVYMKIVSVSAAPKHGSNYALHQCFSNFVRPRHGKFLFCHKTRARPQQIYW